MGVVNNKQGIMKIFKELSIVLLVALIIGFLVLRRSQSDRHFSGNAGTAVSTGDNQSNLVSIDIIKALAEGVTLLNIDSVNIPAELEGFPGITLPFDEITDRELLKKLKEINSKKVLISSDPSLSAKAWVILDQLEIKNLFILDTDKNEALHYNFQPDSTVSAE